VILRCNEDSVRVIARHAKNEPVVIPTDTLYGLAMSVYGPIEKIYKLKNRELEKKIPIGVASIEMMREIAYVEPVSEKLVQAFMPGPLTLVLKSKIPEITGPTVGVRIPDHFVPLRLMSLIGPITMTSANISGEAPPDTIEKTMNVNVKYRIDCGKLPGTASTVVSMIDGVKLIRAGAISFSAILKVMGEKNGP